MTFLIIGTVNVVFSDDEHMDMLLISSVSACDPENVCTSTDIAFPRSKMVQDREMTIQEIVFTHPGDNDSCPLKIDNLKVSSWASSYPGDAPVAYAAYLDDGDGIFNINTDEKIDDEYVYDFSETVILGDDDNSQCLEVLPGTSERVFIRFRSITDVGAGETVRIQVNATDIVNFYDIEEGSYVSSEFTSGEGTEIAFNMFYTENRSDVHSVSINDTNDNGIVDEMIIKTRFPIPDSEYDTLDYVSFHPNEGEFDDELRVTYKDEHVNIDSIDYFVNFTGSLGTSYAHLKIVLDEEDPTLQTDTSAEDFEVSYQSDGDEDTYPLNICCEGVSELGFYYLPVEYFTLIPLDEAHPIIVDSTVSDTIITAEDIDSTFVVTYEFSETMDQTVLPAYDFDPDVNDPDVLLLVTDQEWTDESTYQISYSVEEGEVYYEDVDVRCLTQNCFDLEGNQMNKFYSNSDAFMVDMKPPSFSDLPDGSVNPGQDYTVRVTINDENDIGGVILHYQIDENWNTKSMEYDLGNDQYYAMVTIPEITTDFHYKISAFDIYENNAETTIQELSIEENEHGEEDDDDTDDDGLPDTVEQDLGSDHNDSDDVTTTNNMPGYLVDTDDDGNPDTYVDETTENKINITINENGEYEIDVDFDGTIDYIYNVTTGTAYEQENEQQKTEDSTPGFTTSFVFIAIAALALVFLIFIRRPRF